MIRTEEIEYHRNGVCGRPFHVVLFTDDGRKMMAVVFVNSEEDEAVAVFDRDLLAKGTIAFFFNSWRGDRYSKTLRGHIDLHEATLAATKGVKEK